MHSSRYFYRKTATRSKKANLMLKGMHVDFFLSFFCRRGDEKEWFSERTGPLQILRRLSMPFGRPSTGKKWGRGDNLLQTWLKSCGNIVENINKCNKFIRWTIHKFASANEIWLQVFGSTRVSHSPYVYFISIYLNLSKQNFQSKDYI